MIDMIHFDTLKYVETLQEAGVPEIQANHSATDFSNVKLFIPHVSDCCLLYYRVFF